MAGSKGGRPAKPTALKLIQGTARKDRANPNEPKPRAGGRVPAPPKHLGKMANAEWRRVAKELHALGLLTLVDKEALAQYCKAVQDEREACGQLHKWNFANPDLYNVQKSKVTGTLKAHPAVGMRDTARKQILAFCREFGMTPSSRTGVMGLGADAPENPFDRYK